MTIIDVDEFLVDVRTHSTWMHQVRIRFARLVADLQDLSALRVNPRHCFTFLKSRRPPPPRWYMYTLWSSPSTGFSTNGFSTTFPSTMIASPSSRRMTSLPRGTGSFLVVPLHLSGITTSSQSSSSFALCPGSTRPRSRRTRLLSCRETLGPPSRLTSALFGVGTPIWSRIARTRRRSQSKDCIARLLMDMGGGRLAI